MSKTSFQSVEAQLLAAKCPRCQGSGTIDDADIGDIQFNTFTCPDCQGSGWKDNLSHQLVANINVD